MERVGFFTKINTVLQYFDLDHQIVGSYTLISHLSVKRAAFFVHVAPMPGDFNKEYVWLQRATSSVQRATHDKSGVRPLFN